MSFVDVFNLLSYLITVWTIISWTTEKFQNLKKRRIDKLVELRLAGVIGSEEYYQKRVRI
jgi:hypothetical protein